MATPARVCVWAARGNRTVDVRRLSGPVRGCFVPPPYLAGEADRDSYDLGDPDDRGAAYRMLLAHGTAEDITHWVNAEVLARCMDDLCLAPHVVGPWRQALRDLGLLAGPRVEPVGRGPVRRLAVPEVAASADDAEPVPPAVAETRGEPAAGRPNAPAA